MNDQSQRRPGRMEWDDDLDALRHAMRSIEQQFASSQRTRNSREHQANSIAFLNASVRKALAKLPSLETPHQSGVVIADVLDELLKTCECSFVQNVRFYRYCDDSGDGSYVLVDSSGYDLDSTQRLRVGELVRFKSSCELSRTDTFWAHATRVPVAVSVNQQAPNFIEPKFFSGCLPLVEVPRDMCEEALQGRQTSMWIDFPLFVGGMPTGKLSCDFSGAISDLSTENTRLVEFWANAQIAAATLEVLASKKRSEIPLNEIVGDIQACESTESLCDYCVTKLPVYFGCENASIFTVSTDSLGMSRLVLRRTSYGPAKQFEENSPYRVDDPALTSWVARNNKSLRIHNLSDPSEREYQLDQYRAFDPRLVWKNGLTDSRCHSSFLAVPIPNDANRVGGVIRFTEKSSKSVKLFGEQDQVLLETIARDAIGRRLASLHATQAHTTLCYGDIQRTSTHLVSDRVPSTRDIASILRSVLELTFPGTVGGKLFLLNVITNDCRQLQHFPVGGSLPNSLRPFELYDLDNSLTGYVVKSFLENRANGISSVRSTYINDFKNAQRLGAMMPICDGAQTAIACPVAFRRKIYGVLIVKSDRFDISPEQHSYTLEVIAAQAGILFARRDHACLMQLRKDMQNSSIDDLATWLLQLERRFQGSDPTFHLTPLRSLNLKDVVVRAAEDAGCKSYRIGDHVQDINVVAHEQPLLGIMYSVLKEVCLRPQEQRLQVHGSVRDRWIVVTVKEFFRNADPLQGELWDEDGLEPENNSNLTVARKLAYYNEIESRCGTLKQDDNDLVLRIPAG